MEFKRVQTLIPEETLCHPYARSLERLHRTIEPIAYAGRDETVVVVV